MEKLRLNVNLFLIFMIICFVGCEKTDKNNVSVPSERSARQLSFWPYSNSLSRQIFDMLDIVTDVAMLTLLGIPILGLVAVSLLSTNPYSFTT
jgi:hypothetical protein